MRLGSAQEIWEAALGELQIQVSKSNYRTWFQKTRGLSYEDNQFIVGAPNTFVAEYLDKNQRSLIEKALINLTPPDVKVVFQVNGGHASGATAQDWGVSASARFNPKYSFDSFIEGSGNRLARAAALAISRKPGQSYNPLLIYGGVGLGKTHLLQAIGQAALANHVRLICASAEQFTNEFLSAIRERKTEEFRNKYRNTGMLLIDDIQFINGKEQTEEGFFHTFNELYNLNRQIVITSDKPPKAMPQLDERLRSRYEWGLTVDLQPPDYEMRLAILKAKCEQKGTDLAPDILQFIAARNQQNIRELEGSLNRVVAFAELLGVKPTVEVAGRALEDIARTPPRNSVTPDFIVEAVASSFQISTIDLKGQKRDKDTTMARRIAMYLLRQETNCALTRIGEELGGRDAAAVTNACKKIARDLEASPYLKRKIQHLQESIHSKVG